MLLGFDLVPLGRKSVGGDFLQLKTVNKKIIRIAIVLDPTQLYRKSARGDLPQLGPLGVRKVIYSSRGILEKSSTHYSEERTTNFYSS